MRMETPVGHDDRQSRLTAPTITNDGKRRWIYPDRRSGKKSQVRKRVALLLISFYLLAPFLSFNGLPLMRIDVTEGLVSFWGQAFRFHEASYLAFFFVFFAMLLFIITAVRGRIWCGYACPQTVWIDWVIRPIEEFLEGPAARRQVRDKAPFSWARAWRKAIKHLIFLAISAFLAHVLLAYFVAPSLLLKWLSASPLHHWKSFMLVSATTAVIYFDFAWFREQFCAFLCPYARFQAVMMDEHTPVVAYDYLRGEPRGKKAKGDCIDCGLCQRVCPTGIDIRQGLQLECIHCNRCADACDMIMKSLKRPLGLIREVSAQGLISASAAQPFTDFLRPRVLLYTSFLLVVTSFFAYRLLTRPAVAFTLTRQLGASYSRLADGRIGNLLQLAVVNTTAEVQNLAVATTSSEVEVICSGCSVPLKAFESKSLSVLVAFTRVDLKTVDLRITPSEQVLSLSLLAPRGLPVQEKK